MKTANIFWRDLLRQVQLFPLAALLLTALPLAAQVPSLINYQGRLTDGSGNAVSGNRTMAVRLYDAASGGNLTYAETIGTVAVTNGTYSFRFGSGGAVVVSANETIATTNGTNQVFSGTLQGTPTSGTPSLSDGLYSWTASGGSSNSDAFSVTYNGTAKRFQVLYISQVPLAGRAIVATYQTTEQETIDASLADGEAYLALSVNATEEPTRTRLLAVPFALKAKESADTQALNTQVTSLNGTVAGLSVSQTTLAGNITTLQAQTQSVSESLSAILKEYKVLGLSGNLTFGNTTTSGFFIISNSGFRPLRVSGISYPAGFWGGFSSGTIAIEPGVSYRLDVGFAPTAVQGYSGNISVTSDATSGTRTIPVSGQGSRLVSLSGDLAFGNGTVNVPNRLDFTITNTGTMDLAVSGITYPSGFSGNWSGTISPGRSQSVRVFFTPTTVQSYGGNLSVASNATGGSGLLALSGIGRAVVGLTGSMITVAGGMLPHYSELAGQQVSTFQIGKYEVTWGEWKEVRAWAVAYGYSDLAGVGDTHPSGSADNFPVIGVSSYDAMKWMNARSEKEGLTPVYVVITPWSHGTYRTGEGAPSLNSLANGYRLPSEKEWEWAARGGASSLGNIYSGSNDVSVVAWYNNNSSAGTKAVGTKAANELAIHDMSGNVKEWCEDILSNSARRLRGGWWNSNADYCTIAYRDYYSPSNRNSVIGFRLSRSSGN
jgi:hypothetical protein